MSNLLKEAIADAKAVRATALANAKVALEEAFAPRFEAMFANKLKEDAGSGLPVGNEDMSSVQEDASVSEQEIDNLIKELEAEVGDETGAPPMGDDAGAPPSDDMGSDVPTDEPPVDDMGGDVPAEGAPLVAGQTVKLVVVPDANAAGAGAPPIPPAPEGGEGMPTGGPEMGSGDEDDEVDLNELLESLREESEKEDEECLKESVPVKSSAIAGKVGGSDNKKPSADASATSHIESAGKDRVGGGEGYKGGVLDASTAARPNAKGNFENTAKLAKEAVETGVPTGTVIAKDPSEVSKTPNAGPVTPTDMSTPSLAKENALLKKQIAEQTETLVYVKGQLNEINLLNAKLLYTNKLFKEFTMNNTQKMRVVEMFDLSKNVREVKLTYATISESLNFSVDTKKKVSPSASVQSITEGIASKQVGSTKPSKGIITEGKFASRMKQLAGIHGEKK